jgi:multidrug efflux system membrane fusion protein
MSPPSINALHALPPGPEQKALPPAPPSAPTHKKRRWPWFAALLLALILGYILWPKSSQSATASSTKAGPGGRGSAPTPVVVARATTGDIGVYVIGLGAVTPINTVSIKSRVDGQLMSVHFKEGDLVHQGDLLIEIDPRPYEAALLQYQGQLAKDQATLEGARIDMDRYATLVKQEAIAEQQLADQRALVAQDAGTVKADQGLVDAARTNVAYTRIASPITGVVGLRLVDAGNIVHSADTNAMLVITQIQPISVIFTVAEDQLPPIVQKVRAGQKLPVDAWDRDLKNKLASGTLSTLDNQIDQTTGTLKLRAIFNNDNRGLFPNQFVNARLLVQEKHGVTLIPSAAIQRNTQSTYVYLVKPDSTVATQTIQLGTTEGDQSEVTSGLEPGAVVVLSGVDKLEEGSKVTAHEANGSGQAAGQPASPSPAQTPSSNQPNNASGQSRQSQ